MKNTFLLLAILLITLNSSELFAQTYKTGFDNSTEQEGWVEFRVGANDMFYEWEYSSFNAYSAPNCISHNYPVGGSEVSDDWFVSPVFDFSEGGKIDSVWHNFAGFGLPMDGDTVAIYVLNGSADPDLATSKTMLYNYVDTNYANDNTWTLDTNISIPNLSGQSYIAFRYKTIVNWLDVKFDDIVITQNISTSVVPMNLDQSLVQIFPNPAIDFVSLKYSDDLSVNNISIVDMTGKKVRFFSKNEKTLNLIGLESGLYILRINTDQGILLKKMIKSNPNY